jgi:hypothetical protein
MSDEKGGWECWCGVVGEYDELYSDEDLEETCGGTGVLHCFCGGDFCVCHNHGEVPCHGCEDCDDCGEDDDFYDDDVEESDA